MNLPRRFTTSTASFIIYNFICLVAVMVFFASCRSRKALDTYKYDNNYKVPYQPGTDPFHSSHFFSLRMPKKYFDELKGYSGNKIVFQFFYPAESKNGAPTLFAYKRKNNHGPTGTEPKILEYDRASEEPLYGRAQVLGDQVIKIADLEKLIEKVKGDKNAQFENLIFKPVFVSENPHMAYNISVDGSNTATRSNPSPPK